MIYTFYSYKGGVGRSMALANVAECFYLQGLRVLMVDWDLEAPGLEAFFYDPDPDESGNGTSSGSETTLHGTAMVQSRLGLIDMLTEYKRSYSSILPPQPTLVTALVPKALQEALAKELQQQPASSDSFEGVLDSSMPPLSTYVVPIHSSADHPTASPSASLSLLPAGWRYKDRFAAYGHAVTSFDWEGLYTTCRGKEYFDWLRRKLLEAADVVLIDSRTGVTEMGGVCVRQLADVVVSFVAPNHQNVSGVVRMVSSFKRPETISARNGRSLDTVLVPTRVDTSELADLKLFETRFRRLADERNNAPAEFHELGREFWDLWIPYRAKYSYQERRLIGPGVLGVDPTRGLENAYWKLATSLALLAPENHLIRRQFADRLQLEFPSLPKVVVSHMPDGAGDAAQVQQYLRAAGISLWPDLAHDGDTPDSASPPSAILQAKHVLVVSSERALDDAGPVRRELRLARQLGKAIYVVGLTQHPGAPPLPAWLQGVEVHTRLSEALVKRLLIAPTEIRAPVLVPPLAPGYVTRPAVEAELKAALLAAARTTERAVLALWGPGGSGKSATASRVCLDDDVVDAYAGGIFFVGAGDADAALRIASSVLPTATYADAAAARSALASVLHGRRTLLVLDDAWTEKDVEMARGIGEPATIVVVTRDLTLATSCASTIVRVDRLTPEEAAAFLPDRELVEQLDGSPLALSLARAALQQEKTLRPTAADAAQLLRDRVRRHGAVAFDRPQREPDDAGRRGDSKEFTQSQDRNASVARSVEATLSRLQSWQRKRLEQLVSLCGEGSRSLSEIQDRWLALPGSAGEPPQLTGQMLEGLVRRLSELALVSWDPRTHMVALNPLVRDCLVAQGVVGAAPAGGARGRVSSGKDRQSNPDVDLARRVLGGESLPFDELTALAKRLKDSRYFAYARQLLVRVRQLPGASERRLYWGHQHALCTYKDPDLPFIDRADRALEILGEVDDLDTTTDQETLGLAGAIYKYRWTVDGQLPTLERSLGFYLRGYAQGVEKDKGYTGLNAAFVLDLLAHQEQQSGKAALQALGAVERQKQARKIREEIMDRVAPLARQPGSVDLANQWWFLVTLGEACFGLERFDEARYWLREALAVDVKDWEFESTARQLARLARLHHGGEMPPDDSPESQTLRVFLGNDQNALRSVTTARVGLALSGGGFRASLFHIGVLARLAELDMLRHVEVLSCVSGGSIIGVYYYLCLKQLLESKADDALSREDYVALVKRVEFGFLKGVQTNPRMRLLANPLANLKTALLPHYNRTDRMGELLEASFYSALTGRRKNYLDELLVQSDHVPPDFVPKLDNWRRAAKVPVLVLNATTLNTGHNWQFTAAWMGEPPAGVGREIDGNDLLERMYYWEAPDKHRHVRLGRATAASACVPGIFDPVELQSLYPKRTVRLVDGGVFDNQGVGSLLEQECSVLLVSDASGQSSSQNYPGAEPFQVPLRASGIQSARVRDTSFLDLDGRRRSGQITSLMFIHLKKDLNTDRVDWVGRKDPVEASDDARPNWMRGPLTRYGVRKTLQARLAGIRTDLDSFSDAEAYALMLSGYRMAGHEFSACVDGFPTSKAQEKDWGFFSIDAAMDDARDFDDAHKDLMNILKAGASRALKIWRLSRGLQAFGAVLVALLAYKLFTGDGWATAAGGAAWRGGLVLLAASLAGWLIFRIFGAKKPIAQLLSGLFFGTVGWIPARIHLWFVEPGYLSWGRVRSTGFTGVPLTGAWWRPVVVTAAIALTVLFMRFPVLVPTGRAKLAEAVGNYGAARVQWTRVLEARPTPAAYLGRAKVNSKLGQYREAVADYTRAILLGQRDPGIYRDRWYVYIRAQSFGVPIYVYDSLVADSLRGEIRAASDSSFGEQR